MVDRVQNLFCYAFSVSEYGLYTHKEMARFQCVLLDALVSDVKFAGFDRTKHTVSCDSYPGYTVSTCRLGSKCAASS